MEIVRNDEHSVHVTKFMNSKAKVKLGEYTMAVCAHSAHLHLTDPWRLWWGWTH